MVEEVVAGEAKGQGAAMVIPLGAMGKQMLQQVSSAIISISLMLMCLVLRYW